MLILVLLVTVFSLLSLPSSALAQPPEEEKGYYDKRVSIVSFPSTGQYLPSPSDVADTRAVLKNLRMTGIRYAGLSPEQADDEAKTLRQQGYNAVIGGGHRYLFSDDEGETNAPNVVCGGTYEQLLRDASIMASACRKHGLKFFLHQTSTMVDQKLIERHPGWAAIDIATGKPFSNGYGTANTCINNEEFMAEFTRRLTRLLKESGADGLLQDEIQFFGPTLCGCPSCREKFLAETGLTIPEPGHHRAWLYKFADKSPSARWLEWRRKKVNATLKSVQELVQRENPDGVVINYLANPSAGAPYYMAGYTIDDFPDHSDVVGYECEPPRMQYLYYSPLVIAEMKYQRAVAESMNTGTFRLAYSTSPGEYLWNWCLTKSQGCGDWWMIRDENSKKVALPLLAWDANHEGLSRNLTSAADIGILFSLDARDRNPTNTAATSWLRGYVATCNALTDRHIPYRAIVDRDMSAETLSRKVRTLLLLNTGPMSDRAIMAVRQFVADGGTLIASGDTSRFDEDGTVREDFGLADVFGFHYSGEESAVNTLYIPKPTPFTGSVVGSLPHEYPFTLLKDVSQDVEVLGEMVVEQGKRSPGILSRTYGKGRVLYFSGHPEFKYLHFYFGDDPVEPGKLWTDKRDQRYGDLMAAAAVSGGPPPMTIRNLPAGVVTECYQHENGNVRGVQVRLANLLAGRIQTGVVPVWYGAGFPDVRDHLPESGKPIEVEVRAQGVKNVYLISPDYDAVIELPFTTNTTSATIQLPTVERYSLVYFSQGGDVLSLCQAPLSTTIPAPKPLETEESLPLIGTYEPGSVTVFAGSEHLSGGSEPSIFQGEMSRFIYGSLTTQTKLTATLDVKQDIPRPVLEIGGLEAVAPLRIRLNDQVIFEGTNAFLYDRWSVKAFPLDADLLRAGVNTLEIENTGNGPVSAVPWFGISFVRLRSQADAVKQESDHR